MATHNNVIEFIMFIHLASAAVISVDSNDTSLMSCIIGIKMSAQVCLKLCDSIAHLKCLNRMLTVHNSAAASQTLRCAVVPL